MACQAVELELAHIAPAPFGQRKFEGLGHQRGQRGRSLLTSCSCSATVAVEINTRVPRASASAMAGAQYASDLPTPVPAWMTAMERVGAAHRFLHPPCPAWRC